MQRLMKEGGTAKKRFYVFGRVGGVYCVSFMCPQFGFLGRCHVFSPMLGEPWGGNGMCTLEFLH